MVINHTGSSRSESGKVANRRTHALDVTLQGSATGSIRTVALDGWAREAESLDGLGDAELRAFAMLLHANPDELWSMTGDGD
jgi:hypothetical protein